MYSEHIHREEREGFTIDFYACEEGISPRGEFMDEEGNDDEETLAKIADGTYAYFCAKVTASKEGVELATDYLGACCYNSAEEFCTTYADGYYADMVATVIEEAKATIGKLAAA